jgi:hypothetical protein
MNPIDYSKKRTGQSYDLSGIILHECLCGSDMWNVVVTFDDYEISSYMLDMECFHCGMRAKAPTPIDHPDYKESNEY